MGTYSWHDNGQEDRKFKWRTHQVSVPGLASLDATCGGEVQVNTPDNNMDFTCPRNGLLRRIRSTYAGVQKDRTWYVTCCLIRVNSPSIVSVAPAYAIPGETVVIKASALGPPSGEGLFPVFGGSTPIFGPPAVLSGGSVSATVPLNFTGTPGAVGIRLARFGEPSNALPFEVLFRPVVSGVSPAAGVLGSQVDVLGSEFGQQANRLNVSVGGVQCPISATDLGATPQSITCLTDASLGFGPHLVRVSVLGYDSLGTSVVWTRRPPTTGSTGTTGTTGSTGTTASTGSTTGQATATTTVPVSAGADSSSDAGGDGSMLYIYIAVGAAVCLIAVLVAVCVVVKRRRRQSDNSLPEFDARLEDLPMGEYASTSAVTEHVIDEPIYGTPEHDGGSESSSDSSMNYVDVGEVLDAE
jgi:Dermatopontin/IPT/TIG domain